MGSSALFWLAIIFANVGIGIRCAMDVTTVYRNYEFHNYSSTQAECHARTNALGLPFITPNGSTIDPHVGVELPSCHRPNCPWTYRDWHLVGGVEQYRLPPLEVPPEVYQFTTNGSAISDYISIAHPHVVFSVRTAIRGVARIMLLTEPDVTKSDMYVIDLVHNDLYKIHMSSLVFKCGIGLHYRQSVVILPGAEPRKCYTIGNQHVRWVSDQHLKFRLNIEGDNLMVHQDGLMAPLVAETDQSKLNIKYIAFMTVGIERFWTVHLEARAWLLIRSGGWLRSPNIFPTVEKICVSFFSYIQPDRNATIKVTAKLANGTRKTLGLVSSSEEGKWMSQRMTVDLGLSTTGAGQEIQVLIQGQSEFNMATVAIHGLKGCNPFDHEDIALLEVPPEKAGFICSMEMEKQNTTLVGKECEGCLHGGVCDFKGVCVCPPGFAGDKCVEGCGQNSYGRDCSGTCSGRYSGCAGMLLCTTTTGCNCAPGFTGPTCEIDCEDGDYGVNCSQSCGNCVNGTTCDKFTGMCYEGCGKGFNPPLCKITNRYMKNPPNITEIEFNKAMVEFWLRPEDMHGAGKPYFYHVQYREADETKWDFEPPQLIPVDVQASPITYTMTNLTPGKSYSVRVLLYNEDGSSYDNEMDIPESSFTTECQIPATPIYNLKATWNRQNGFDLEWTYDGNSASACELEYFEVFIREGWRRFLYAKTKQMNMVVTERTPNYTYWVQVQAVTNQGSARAAEPVMVVTAPGAPSVVLRMHYRRITADELDVSWDQPKISGGDIKYYAVRYKCIRYLACNEDVSCSKSSGNVMSLKTDVHLAGLIPFAQYEILVAGYTIELGPFAKILATTIHSEPNTAPEPSLHPVVSKTNESLSLTWLPAEDCRLLNGYPIGYQYTLSETRGDEKVIVSTGNVTKPPVTFRNLMSHQEYELHVLQQVTGGNTNPGHQLVIIARTRGILSSVVLDLHVVHVSPRTVELEWSMPKDVPLRSIEYYLVTYSCEQLLACPPDLKCGENRTVVTTGETIVLKGLAPYAEIQVQVAAYTGEIGDPSTILVKTLPSAPEVAPEQADLPVVDRGETWATIQWRPPNNCTNLHGPLSGYFFRFLNVDPGTQFTSLVVQGRTNDTTATFTHLTAHAKFIAQIFAVVSSDYLVADNSLNITVWTRSQPPNAVHLDVYRRGHDYIGLRWLAPEYSPGQLETVVIRYSTDANEGDLSEIQIKMQACSVWHEYFCYDLKGLQENAAYRVVVRVLSLDNDVEGLPAEVTSVTTSDVPEPPSFLRMVKKNSTSITIAWGYPNKTNGILKSFQITYQQFQSFLVWQCCEETVNIEFPVDIDKPEYSTDLIGLKVASSYMIHVATTTTEYVSTPLKLSATTRPGHPNVKDSPPKLIPGTITNTTVDVKIHKATNELDGPISAYFLIVNTPNAIPNNLEEVAPKLQPEFKEIIGTNSYVAIELLGLEVDPELPVTLGNGGVVYGVYGRYVNKPLEPRTTYSLRLLVMSEYQKDRSYSFVDGATFETLP